MRQTDETDNAVESALLAMLRMIATAEDYKATGHAPRIAAARARGTFPDDEPAPFGTGRRISR